MGVVRERGRKSQEEGESQAVLGTRDKAGQPQRPDIQSNQRGQGEGQGPGLSHSYCVEGKTRARKARSPPLDKKEPSPTGAKRLDGVLSFSVQGCLWTSP